MALKTRLVVGLLILTPLLSLPAPADAQLRRIRDVARRTAESEADAIVARLVRDAIRCAVDDSVCAKKAEESGEEVIFVDEDGEVITDEDGVPITDRDAAVATQPAPPKPGEGAWANYDFVPGDRILFYDDFTNDVVGDFPRRLEFVNGNWDVIDWEGRRLFRNTGPRAAAFMVPLPEALPMRFTIEFEAYFPHGNQSLAIATDSPGGGSGWSSVGGNAFRVGPSTEGTGVIHTSGRGGSTDRTEELAQQLVPIRIMVDDTYAKVYVGERRVANIPNAEFVRGESLYFENTYFADEDYPMLFGPIRVAAGGADLYSRLEAEGRVATQGILFAYDSDRLEPESTPTLEEIGRMLQDHPELRLAIEGHTDGAGDETYNLELSESRAQSVQTFLIETYAIDPSRLEAAGFGESNPVADNSSPEGKQQNRRVELVRLDG
jgi:OOP family OmpA-OmpF porin